MFHSQIISFFVLLDAGIIHAAERINDKQGEQEMLTAEKDMIGPHLGKVIYNQAVITLK